MSTILKHRRGGDEKDYDHSGIEEGQFRTRRSKDGDNNGLSSIDGKSKKQGWHRVGLSKKCAIATIFFCLLFFGQRWMPRTPKLPILHLDIDVPDVDDWPLIHIVQSRFMQEQGPLETLGMARLKLFTAFCLPSMVQQSSQNYFWVIKTDPEFTTTFVFGRLVELVKSHDNIYVVASNANFVFGSAGREGSWRDGKEALDLLQSKIYTGNIAKLKVAMALREERPVLETRLDADDGLHKNFVEYIQDEALKRFRPSENSKIGDDSLIPNWLYWCSRRHIEWHSDTDGSLSEEHEANVGNVEFGYMNMIQHDKICVTPGITVGYNAVVGKAPNAIDVPKYDHDVLYKKLENSASCYNDNKGINVLDETETRGPCLELIEDFLFCAIRSRTWTSAGMDKVDLAANDGSYQEKDLTEKLWAMSKRAFGVTKANVKNTQEFLIRNKKAIAQENLLGQCASGHSCKDSAKVKLRKIVDSKTKD